MYMLENNLLKHMCFNPLSLNYFHTYKLALMSPIKKFYIGIIWVKCFVVQFCHLAKNLVKFFKSFSIIFNASMSTMASTSATNTSSLFLMSLVLSLTTLATYMSMNTLSMSLPIIKSITSTYTHWTHASFCITTHQSPPPTLYVTKKDLRHCNVHGSI